jgi:hypothetical protein
MDTALQGVFWGHGSLSNLSLTRMATFQGVSSNQTCWSGFSVPKMQPEWTILDVLPRVPEAQ